MITEKVGNLLIASVQGIVHQCNCFHTMGSGIAAQIKQLYPQAYIADLQTPYGDAKKLGTFSMAKDKNKYIFNLYGQFNFGVGRQTSYDALYDGFVSIRTYAKHNNIKTLGLPKNLGCGLGGGNWNIVSTIISEVFKDASTDIEIYCLTN